MAFEAGGILDSNKAAGEMGSQKQSPKGALLKRC